MKRFHVHLSVADLDQSIRFYSGLFGAPPTVRKVDYAKWMIDDPRVNFAISARGGNVGVNHLGLQADSAEELAGVRAQFAAADHASLLDEPGANCCYAKSDKHWVTDPQGIAWEGYHTLGEVRYFDGDHAKATPESACCTPALAKTAQPTASCCAPAADNSTARCCD
jgi:catechol 2,3-dioxygenase-like lactoylglutathione lyase family enzyme